ncbi:MAG: general secretion pathway protein GspB [Steroidobacterales bacterium]
MSLILDALKKSEAERQRQSGPTLLEVRVTQPRRRYPAWVIAVVALLAVNLLLLAFVLHRPASPQIERALPPAPATAPAAVAASLPAATAAPSASALPAAVAPVANRPAALAGTDASAPVAGSIDPAARAVPPPEAGIEASDGARNPADDEPAVLPGGAGARPERGSAGRYANLPSFSDVGGDLPELRLDLHVFGARARDRYALINMHRVHEGDALPEGPRVLAITREGVALDYRGQEFMLRPQ